MEDQVMKLLGPWPVLQLIFGLSVLGFGAWMITRGVTKKGEAPPPISQIEDKRAQWEAYNQLKNIEEQMFKQTELLSRIMDRLNNNADQMKALAAAIWNRGQGKPWEG